MSDRDAVHVIDDGPIICESILLLLSSAGLEVNTYPSVIAFLENVGTLGGGCVLTDARMPDMTGVELLHQLKQRRVTMPVIMMSWDDDASLAMAARKAGALEFLEKPFDCDHLIAAVQAALAAP